jgi:hypothetical protein
VWKRLISNLGQAYSGFRNWGCAYSKFDVGKVVYCFTKRLFLIYRGCLFYFVSYNCRFVAQEFCIPGNIPLTPAVLKDTIKETPCNIEYVIINPVIYVKFHHLNNDAYVTILMVYDAVYADI